MPETKSEIDVETWGHWLHPIFARCVDPDAVRFDLSRPFVIDEYVYATDAKIAVRMPVPEWWMISNPDCIPRSVVDILEGALCRALPATFPPVEGACKVCLGAKVMPEMGCPYCGGKDAPRYDDVPPFCEECWQFEGKIPAGPCYECGGSGILDWSGRLEVSPGYWLQRRYVALLHEFEMTTYLPIKLDSNHVTRFTLGDITGVLMPMTAPDPGRP
jgi:hypothetical protein